jgi:hypothetical protein
MKKNFKFVIEYLIFTGCLICAVLFLNWLYPYQNISAHTDPNFHRIRQDDGILIYKFQDGNADCYVSANKWLHNTSQTSPSISCIKR